MRNEVNAVMYISRIIRVIQIYQNKQHGLFLKLQLIKLRGWNAMLVFARTRPPLSEILLWMTPSEPPRALQASECSELLDPTRASCLIPAQRQPGKFIPHWEPMCKAKLPHNSTWSSIGRIIEPKTRLHHDVGPKPA